MGGRSTGSWEVWLASRTGRRTTLTVAVAAAVLAVATVVIWLGTGRTSWVGPPLTVVWVLQAAVWFQAWWRNRPPADPGTDPGDADDPGTPDRTG